MATGKVSNEQLYDLMKQFHADLVQLRTDFNQFKTQTTNEFKVIHGEVKDIREELKEIREEIKDLRQEQRYLRQTMDRFSRKQSAMEDKIDDIHISWNHKLIAGTVGASAAVGGLVAWAVANFS